MKFILPPLFKSWLFFRCGFLFLIGVKCDVCANLTFFEFAVLAFRKMGNKSKNVKVVVLGDIGRSPRMQYHCLSLAEEGHKVDLIGYGETHPMEAMKQSPFIFYHYLFPVPSIPIKLLNYIFKTLFQAINLLFLLLVTTRSDILIVQNPPAIPSLAICWIYTRLVGAKLVIDWHNYAYTIMALSVGKRNPLVRITREIEAFIGSRADINFCVTRAMRDDLKSTWNITASVLYDRPPSIFRAISLQEKHDFLTKFADNYDKLFRGESENQTLFTEIKGETVELIPSRPGLLVSSTSWTEDEDFSVLLAALQEYENHHQSGNTRHLPKLICVITGKGPMKEYYLTEINRLNFQNVSVITPWLESADYPSLLACADLGVSLHTSSSGLDLPMKVVDMFGCELPVCAFNFKCLDELVKDGENSYTFATSQELSAHILNWFEDFPNNPKQRECERQFKTELHSFQNLRWQENWKIVAGPVLNK